MSKITKINNFWLFLIVFSMFLPQIICIYPIGTWKQHFLIRFRVPRGRRGPKWSFCLQNPSENGQKSSKMTIFYNLKDFEGISWISMNSDDFCREFWWFPIRFRLESHRNRPETCSNDSNDALATFAGRCESENIISKLLPTNFQVSKAWIVDEIIKASYYCRWF